jgi:hypothetical protein
MTPKDLAELCGFLTQVEGPQQYHQAFESLLKALKSADAADAAT